MQLDEERSLLEELSTLTIEIRQLRTKLHELDAKRDVNIRKLERVRSHGN